MPDELFLHSFGMPSRDIIRRVWGEGLSAVRIREIDDEKEQVYRELVRGMLPLTIGVREMLHGLRDAGLVLAVATSGPPENLELVLSEGRLTGWFAAAVHGFDVEHGKPAPDCFLMAAERAGLRPSSCVVVEDAPAGIAAAQAAGMPVVGFVGTHPAQRLREAGVNAVVERLADVTPALVGELLAEGA